MKNLLPSSFFGKVLAAACAFIAVWLMIVNASAQTLPASGTDITTTATYTVPTNVISLQIETWGGGGGGGGANITTSASFAAGSGGGGGGGAYSKVASVAVTPGQNITVTIGVGGAGNSGAAGSVGGTSQVTYNATVVCSSVGGSGGGVASGTDVCVKGTAGAGGGSGTGFSKAGGNGAAGSGSNCNIGGGGGGGAGSTAVGGNASGTTAGTGGVSGGGNGGNGGTVSLNPVNGSAASTTNYGGGGGGGAAWPQPSGTFKQQSATGGAGRQGKVVITYTTCTPPTSGTISGPSQVCSGGTGYVYTINGVGGTVTSYTWTFPSGVSLLNTNGTTSTTMNVNWGSTFGPVTCVPANSSGACQDLSVTAFPVSVIPTPAQPSVITVPAPICQGTPQPYFVATSADAASYSWTNTPGGWTGSSTAATINLTANSTPTNITVTPFNSCNVAGPTRSSGSVSPNLPVPLTPSPIVHQ